MHKEGLIEEVISEQGLKFDEGRNHEISRGGVFQDVRKSADDTVLGIRLKSTRLQGSESGKRGQKIGQGSKI